MSEQVKYQVSEQGRDPSWVYYNLSYFLEYAQHLDWPAYKKNKAFRGWYACRMAYMLRGLFDLPIKVN